MRKEEYLQKLDELLYNILAEDRYEAIQFYSDYLEDAGADVDEVIRSLGTPEELAKSIQRNLYGDNVDGDYTRVNKDVPGTYRAPFSTGGHFTGSYSEGQGSGNQKQEKEDYRKGKLTTWQWVIFLILCLCAAPVIVSVCGVVLSVIFAILLALIGVVFGAGIAGIALVIAAIVVIIVAIVKVVFSPLSSLIMIGGGLLMVGIGFLGIAFTAWMVFKVLPKIFAWVVDLCCGIVHRK